MKEKIKIKFEDFGSMFIMHVSPERIPEKDILFVSPSYKQIENLMKKYDCELEPTDIKFFERLQAAYYRDLGPVPIKPFFVKTENKND